LPVEIVLDIRPGRVALSLLSNTGLRRARRDGSHVAAVHPPDLSDLSRETHSFRLWLVVAGVPDGSGTRRMSRDRKYATAPMRQLTSRLAHPLRSFAPPARCGDKSRRVVGSGASGRTRSASPPFHSPAAKQAGIRGVLVDQSPEIRLRSYSQLIFAGHARFASRISPTP
jgi:hypothetical protein